MKKVLFICVHNSGRSQMAEGFFNLLAQGKGTATSAGTQPANAINPVVAEAMREVGIDIGHKKPKALSSEMLEQADRVITMGCGAEVEAVCPATFVQTEDWALDDPKGRPVAEIRQIRKQIQAKVVELLEEIA